MQALTRHLQLHSDQIASTIKTHAHKTLTRMPTVT